MKIEKALCPYCGASLNILPYDKTVKCEYCGSKSYITDTGAVVEQKQEEPSHITFNQSRSVKKGTESTWEQIMLRYRKKIVLHSLFPPPGFRTKNIFHMFVASIGYISIIFFCHSIELLGSKVLFVTSSLTCIDIFTDWSGVFEILKGTHSEHWAIRIFSKIVWCVIFFFVWVFIIALFYVMLK